jgi:hypothetical protein
MRTLRVITAALLCAGLLVAPSTAVSAAPSQDPAPRKRPPRAVLFGDGGSQRGVIWSYCWTYSEDDWGVGSCGDGFYSWRTPLEVTSGSKVKLVFRWAQQPSRLSIRGWARVRPNGSPRGSGEKLAYRLRPERSPGEGITGWAAHFRVPDRTGHLYLDAYGRWNGESSGGDASYNFHLLLR